MIKKIIGLGSVFIIAKFFSFVFVKILPLLVPNALYAEINLFIIYEAILIYVFIVGYDRVLFRFFTKEKNTNAFWTNVFYYWKYVVVVLFIINLFLLKYYFFNLKLILALLVNFTILLGSFREISAFYHRLQKNTLKLFYTIGLIIILKSLITLVLIGYFPSIDTYIIVNFSVHLILLAFPIFKKIKTINNSLLDRKKAKKYFIFAIPLVINGIAINLLNYIDRIMIEKFIGIEELGIYSFGYNFGGSLFFIVTFFNSFLEPYIMNIKNKIKREKYFNKYISFLIVILTIAAIVLYIIVNIITKKFYNPIYLKSFPILAIISLTYIIMPIVFINKIKIELLEKTKQITLSFFFATLINIILNLFLLPKYGIEGAAFATLLSFICLILILNLFLSKKNIFKNNKIQYYNTIIVLLLSYIIYLKYYIFASIFMSLIIFINFKNFIVFFNYINKKNNNSNLDR